MKKKAFQIILSLMFVIFISSKVDISSLRTSLHNVQIKYLILSTVAALFGPVLLAAKYKVLIKKTSLDTSLKRIICINYISRFLALFIPTAVAQTGIRWYKISKDKEDKLAFFHVLVNERLSFIWVLFVAGSVPLSFNHNQHVNNLLSTIFPTIILGYVVLILVTMYLFFNKVKSKINYFLLRLMPNIMLSVVEKIKSKISSQIQYPLATYVFLLFLSIGWQIVFVARLYFIFIALNLPFTFLDTAWMGSFILFLQILPVTFAGLGLREGVLGALVTFYGIPMEVGVTAGILFFTQMLMLAGVGWILMLLERDSNGLKATLQEQD